eukprot:31270-Pelagococcus_subviridis.AAC.18
MNSFFAGSYPITVVRSFTGRYSSPNANLPSGFGAPSQSPTSSRFGTVALHATKRTFPNGFCRMSGRSLRTLKRDTTASSAPPRSSPRRCTSSIITSAQSAKKDIPPRSLFFRVIASNFSGVVRRTSTVLRSLNVDSVKSVSPVMSLHVMPSGENREIHSSFFS